MLLTLSVIFLIIGAYYSAGNIKDKWYSLIWIIFSGILFILFLHKG